MLARQLPHVKRRSIHNQMNFKVEAREAAEISWSSVPVGMIDEMETYYTQIYHELARLTGYQTETWGRCWPYQILLALWNAGRIQGVREERSKRREAAE